MTIEGIGFDNEVISALVELNEPRVEQKINWTKEQDEKLLSIARKNFDGKNYRWREINQEMGVKKSSKCGMRLSRWKQLISTSEEAEKLFKSKLPIIINVTGVAAEMKCEITKAIEGEPCQVIIQADPGYSLRIKSRGQETTENRSLTRRCTPIVPKPSVLRPLEQNHTPSPSASDDAGKADLEMTAPIKGHVPREKRILKKRSVEMLNSFCYMPEKRVAIEAAINPFYTTEELAPETDVPSLPTQEKLVATHLF